MNNANMQVVYEFRDDVIGSSHTERYRGITRYKYNVNRI